MFLLYMRNSAKKKRIKKHNIHKTKKTKIMEGGTVAGQSSDKIPDPRNLMTSMGLSLTQNRSAQSRHRSAQPRATQPRSAQPRTTQHRSAQPRAPQPFNYEQEQERFVNLTHRFNALIQHIKHLESIIVSLNQVILQKQQESQKLEVAKPEVAAQTDHTTQSNEIGRAHV